MRLFGYLDDFTWGDRFQRFWFWFTLGIGLVLLIAWLKR